jgi:Alpha/beta hydrolase family
METVFVHGAGFSGPGFVDDVVSVRAHLTALDGPAVVVAHSYLDLEAGTFALRPEFAAGIYLQDCPDDVVAPAVERLVRQSVTVSAAPAKVVAWQAIPSTYLICADDLGTPPAVQRQQAERADRVAELASGHHPFLSMPEQTADLVLGP